MDGAILFASDAPTAKPLNGMILLDIAGAQFVMSRYHAMCVAEAIKRTVATELDKVVPFEGKRPRKAVRA